MEYRKICNPVEGMRRPHSAVLTAAAALRYFQTINAAGRTLARLDDNSLWTVAAVVADLPAQSHFQFDIFLTTLCHEQMAQQLRLPDEHAGMDLCGSRGNCIFCCAGDDARTNAKGGGDQSDGGAERGIGDDGCVH